MNHLCSPLIVLAACLLGGVAVAAGSVDGISEPTQMKEKTAMSDAPPCQPSRATSRHASGI